MPQLPILSGKEIVKILEKFGYRIMRQRGSHIRLYCESKKHVTVPNYPKVDRSLLKKIIREIDMSSEEFISLLEK